MNKINFVWPSEQLFLKSEQLLLLAECFRDNPWMAGKKMHGGNIAMAAIGE